MSFFLSCYILFLFLFLCFFLLLRSSPTSSLFPYTTLFRSAPTHQQQPRPAPAGQTSTTGARSRLWEQDRHHQGDRKSTRLNSSHVAISYAVFCLKKKKNVTHIIYRKQTIH